MEGPLAAVQGVRPEQLAYPGAAASLPKLWIAVRANLRAVLEHVSIADLAAGELPADIVDIVADPDAWLSHSLDPARPSGMRLRTRLALGAVWLATLSVVVAIAMARRPGDVGTNNARDAPSSWRSVRPRRASPAGRSFSIATRPPRSVSSASVSTRSSSSCSASSWSTSRGGSWALETLSDNARSAVANRSTRRGLTRDG
jgi:hypothetical protein